MAPGGGSDGQRRRLAVYAAMSASESIISSVRGSLGVQATPPRLSDTLNDRPGSRFRSSCHFATRRSMMSIVSGGASGARIANSSPPMRATTQIFEPFFTTKGNRGTGLGLSSVYGIVKQSGGYIWCDSTPGQGTTFTIYLKPPQALPRQRRRPLRHRNAPPEATSGSSSWTMSRLCDGCWPAFCARGYDVFEAEDGHSALAFMGSANRMDLVVTDIVMPVMTGVRFAEQIRSQWPAVKILFVSGFPTTDALPPSELSSIPLLGKPFTPEQIEAKVRELLDR